MKPPGEQLRPLKVFISYRRNDEPETARLIRDALARVFAPENVFFDIDTITIGEDFPAALERALAQSDVLLAIIGKQWHAKRRLFQPEDFVRMEILGGLNRAIPTVPLFVKGAPSPPREEVPSELYPLLDRNGLAVAPDPSFVYQMEALAAAIRKLAPHKVGEAPGKGPSDEPHGGFGTLLAIAAAAAVVAWIAWLVLNRPIIANQGEAATPTARTSLTSGGILGAEPRATAPEPGKQAVPQGDTEPSSPSAMAPVAKTTAPASSLRDQLQAVVAKSGKQCTVILVAGSSSLRLDCCGRQSSLGSEPTAAKRATNEVLSGLGTGCSR